MNTFKSELWSSDSTSGSLDASENGGVSSAPGSTDAPSTSPGSGLPGDASSDATTAATTLAPISVPSAEHSTTDSGSSESAWSDDGGSSASTKSSSDATWTDSSSASAWTDDSSESGYATSSSSLRSGSTSASAASYSPAPTAAASASSGSSSRVSQSPFESSQGVSTTSGDSTSAGMSASSIIGIVVATVGVLLVAVVFVFWRKRQSRYSSSSMKTDSLRFESTSGRNAGSTGAFKAIPSDRHQQFTLNMNGGSNSSLQSHVSQPDDGPWSDSAIIAARIPMDLIDKQELISRGGFGQVFSGIYNGETVAIKTLLPENRKDMKEIEAFFAEVQLMAELEHPRIVRFIGVGWNALSDVCCVTEFMVGGDLRALLMHYDGDAGDSASQQELRRPHGFDFEKVQIALHIAHGLTYLHSLDPVVLHRDLKSRNVLLSSTMEAKLTDFGVSRHRIDGLMTCNVGTSLWMAPEVMMGRMYDEKADIFSFGVLLSEIDAHVMPYANVINPATGRRMAEPAILQMVAVGKLQVEFSPECSEEMRALGRACTALNPAERPSAGNALYRLQLVLKALQEQEVSL